MRPTIIISLILTILLVAIAAILLMTHPHRPGVVNTNSSNTTPTKTHTVTNTNTTVAVSDTQAHLQLVARNFAEIYGSESSDQPGQNVQRAADYAAPAYAVALRAQAVPKPTGAMHVIRSKAFVVNVNSARAQTATVTVGLQRQETVGTLSKTYNQNLVETLQPLNGTWVVSNAVWK